jgi:alpha-D-xyloside xylohydrolase
LHANYSYRVPWAFDEEAVDVLRKFTKLKATLMPYLYQAARTAHLDGVPVMRAMVVEFPDDPACTYLDRQYLLGSDLLVAPVFTEDGTVDYYVPDGEWTHYLTGETITGPRWVRERHGFDSVPLLVRPGAVLPVGATDDRPDYDYADGVTLRVYGIADGATVITEVPTAAGDVAATFTTSRRGDAVYVTVDNAPERWRVQLAGAEPVDAQGSSLIVHI